MPVQFYSSFLTIDNHFSIIFKYISVLSPPGISDFKRKGQEITLNDKTVTVLKWFLIWFEVNWSGSQADDELLFRDKEKRCTILDPLGRLLKV